MDLRQHLDNLRNEFAAVAEAAAGEAAGSEERLRAERLFTQLEAATRLTMLDVLSDAADEITRELAPGSVHVRLSGREPAFVVTQPAARESAPAAEPAGPPAAAPPAAPPEGDDGGSSRINLRLPDHLKARAEEAAGQAGLSVNAWLVRAVSGALEAADPARRPARPESRPGQHVTGWVR